jgi:hypothetical protein
VPFLSSITGQKPKRDMRHYAGREWLDFLRRALIQVSVSGCDQTCECGTIDARTPISNAEEYRKGLPTSTPTIIENALPSDPLFLSPPKIKDGMLEFLKGQPVSVTRIARPPRKFAPLRKTP